MRSEEIKVPEDQKEKLKLQIDRTIFNLERYFGKKPINIKFKTLEKGNLRAQITIRNGRRIYFSFGTANNHYVALNKAKLQMKRKLSGEKKSKGRRHEPEPIRNRTIEKNVFNEEIHSFDQAGHFEGMFSHHKKIGQLVEFS